MKSFVNLSLSQLNVTKIDTDKFRVDIQILIEEKDAVLAINLLKSKNFRQISEIKIVQSKESSKTNSYNNISTVENNSTSLMNSNNINTNMSNHLNVLKLFH